MEVVTNEVFIMNLKTEETQLVSSFFRRRDHAMSLIYRFLTVHGGIDDQYEVKNTLFYFDCETNKWHVPQQHQMPSLSHHAMVTVPHRIRKKNWNFNEAITDSTYIFGGKNEKDVSSNKLYKIRVRESGDLITEEVVARGAPYPRHSASVQFIQPCYLCVYGGKGDDQFTGRNIAKGIFNDLYLFNTDKKEWICPYVNLELPFRFGASSTVFKNKLYILGGSEVNGFSDGNLLQLVIAREGEEEDMQDTIHRRGRFRG